MGDGDGSGKGRRINHEVICVFLERREGEEVGGFGKTEMLFRLLVCLDLGVGFGRIGLLWVGIIGLCWFR